MRLYNKLAIALVLAATVAVSAQNLGPPGGGGSFSPPAITCTNQFVRSVAAATGVGTCASIAQADLTALAGQYPGVTTNTVAAAGNIGQIITNTVPLTTVSLSSGAAINAGTVSLTAGEWDVQCTVYYDAAASTTVSSLYASVSATTGVRDLTLGNYSSVSFNSLVLTNSTEYTMTSPIVRVSLSGTTSEFCVAFSSFAVSTLTAGGFIRATRVH